MPHWRWVDMRWRWKDSMTPDRFLTLGDVADVLNISASQTYALVRSGALPAMLPPFWFGAGGPIGSGRQYWPWIHRADWIGLVRWIVDTPAASGAINATGPAPVTNREFVKALGRAMHRPALIPAPAFATASAAGR